MFGKKSASLSEKKWEIDRRTFLRGMGAALALPVLEIMTPSLLRQAYAAGTTDVSRLKTLFFYRACGYPGFSTNSQTGFYQPDFDTLNNSTKLRGKFSHIYNLSLPSHQWANYTGDGRPSLGGGHTPNMIDILSGSYAPWIKGTPKFAVGETANNTIARIQKGNAICIGLGNGQSSGGLEVGGDVSSLHGYALSNKKFDPNNSNWVPDYQYVDPSELYTFLFGSGASSTGSGGTTSTPGNPYKKSILDLASADIKSLKLKASSADQVKLDEYFESIRKVELQINDKTVTVGGVCAPGIKPNPYSNDITKIDPRTLPERLDIMENLLVIAMQCDRISTAHIEYISLMSICDWVPGWNNAGGPRNNMHALSHHDGLGDSTRAASEMDNYRRLIAYFCNRFTKFAERLSDTLDANDKSLLDNTICFEYTEIGEGDSHTGSKIVNAVGGYGGKWKHSPKVDVNGGTSVQSVWASAINIVSSGSVTSLGNGAREAPHDNHENQDLVANDMPHPADKRFIA